MLSRNYNYLTVPGLNGSGDKHWQTLWENANKEITRVEQKDWDNPFMQEWVEMLEHSIKAASDKPVVLIAHSLGCATTIHAASQGKLQHVAGLFLVALPDVERKDFPKQCVGFSPLPKFKMTIPTLLVGSENDKYITAEKTIALATIFNIDFVSVGKKTHINADSGLGLWTEGWDLFQTLLLKIKDSTK